MAKDPHNRAVVQDPFARRLMVRYLARREDDVRLLREALARRDFDSIETKGHKLFGSGSAYGLDRVSELGAALEKTARKKNGDAVAELIERLEAFICSVRVV
jgi:HPt (histidine-containing phosphotransfer) domain-containing protein